MPIVKDKSGKCIVVDYDEYRDKYKEDNKRNRIYNLPKDWEKEQKIYVQDNGIFIEYRNDNGNLDYIEGFDYGDEVLPKNWLPNNPMGWKDPNGNKHPCQWCFEDDSDYDDYFHQYICVECHELMSNPDDDDLMFLPPEDIDEW